MTRRVIFERRIRDVTVQVRHDPAMVRGCMVDGGLWSDVAWLFLRLRTLTLDVKWTPSPP